MAIAALVPPAVEFNPCESVAKEIPAAKSGSRDAHLSKTKISPPSHEDTKKNSSLMSMNTVSSWFDQRLHPPSCLSAMRSAW